MTCPDCASDLPEDHIGCPYCGWEPLDYQPEEGILIDDKGTIRVHRCRYGNCIDDNGICDHFTGMQEHSDYFLVRCQMKLEERKYS